MPPSFPFTEVKSMSRWTNYTGTIPERAIPLYCTPDVAGEAGTTAPRRMARHGAALKAIIGHCFDSPSSTLRAIGSRWSLSRIIEPGDVVLDPANMNVVLRVKADWLDPQYRATRAAQQFTPIFAQGGTQIASLNRRLAEAGLAVQTSGAGDGQRLAGCLATGTHGSALGIGAMHDTALGFHLVVGPSESVFVQRATAPACGPEVSAWLERETGIPTRHVLDDDWFAAAQVNLGSLGFVHGVILETVPLYALRGRQIVRRFADADVWRTLSDLQTERLHPDVRERPYHFEVIFHPYPANEGPGAFIRVFWKHSADGIPLSPPSPAIPDASSDLMGLISGLSDIIDAAAPTWALRLLFSDQLERRFKPGDLAPRHPGNIFGPTSLPPGRGASTEVIVAQRYAHRSLEVLYDVLRREAARGNHLLGPVAVRFVPQTGALLGMNVHGMNAYIELPSVRNDEVLTIFRRWWDELEAASIPFTCHWGQQHGMTPSRLETFFGQRPQRWKAARRDMLSSEIARRVFAAPLLAEVGLNDP